MVYLSGKTVFRKDRNYGQISLKKGGGVCIYVDNKWSNFATLNNEYSYSDPDLEILTLNIDKPGCKKMTVSCAYRPPKSNLQNTVDKLVNIFRSSKASNREFWIGGDLNLDWNKRNHVQLQSIKSSLRECGLKQLISGVTRPLCTGGTCIDWLITNSKFVSDFGVANDLISDHLPVYVVKKKIRNHHETTRKLTRTYKKFDPKAFETLLKNSTWDPYDACEDPDECWEIIEEKISQILSIMCPLKLKRVFTARPEWLTSELLEFMNERNRYTALSKRTGAVLYFKISRYLRNQCNSMINKAKGEYIKGKLAENVRDPKRFWRDINCIISPKQTSTEHERLLDPVSNCLVDHGIESDLINSYYANIGSNILRESCSGRSWDYDKQEYHW